MGHLQVHVRVLNIELALLLLLGRVLGDLAGHHLPPLVWGDGPLLPVARLALAAHSALFLLRFSLSIELLRVSLNISNRR